MSTRQKKTSNLNNRIRKSGTYKALLREMITEMDSIIEYALLREEKLKTKLEKIHPEYRGSAINMIHYRAFRSFDLRDLQKKLGNIGLSRMANSELHVMASLQNVRSILKALLAGKPINMKKRSITFKKGVHKRNKNTKALLGKKPKNRRTRIMVTMPSSAAEDKKLIQEMINAGMNCARINCAHDGPEIWKKIINNIKKVSKANNKPCKIAMDIAGPKIRTGMIKAGPQVLKLKPIKDLLGKVTEPLHVWLGLEPPKENLKYIPISQDDLDLIKGSSKLYFFDARGKKRKLALLESTKTGVLASCVKTSFMTTGLKLYFDKEKTHKAFVLNPLPSTIRPIILNIGDTLRLDKGNIIGDNATYSNGNLVEPAHISCTAPSIFDEVAVGERVLFDDGRITGIIRKKAKASLTLEITYASLNGSKLNSEKGINLPDTELTISGLTEKDKKDLPFVVKHADLINFSFVNQKQDIKDLYKKLKSLNAFHKIGIVLKIETKSGYNKLTDILLEAMKTNPIGVMIARGDLAVETGWENIGNEQEEILSICQAAGVTDIWATQVLEGLAKTGLPSRAEITDAVMAQRADCVMLNKGPFIIEGINLLDTILEEMEPHWDRNKLYSPIMKRL